MNEDNHIIYLLLNIVLSEIWELFVARQCLFYKIEIRRLLFSFVSGTRLCYLDYVVFSSFPETAYFPDIQIFLSKMEYIPAYINFQELAYTQCEADLV